MQCVGRTVPIFHLRGFTVSAMVLAALSLSTARPAQSQDSCALYWDTGGSPDSIANGTTLNGAQAVAVSPGNGSDLFAHVYVAAKAGDRLWMFHRAPVGGAGITELQPLGSPNPLVHGSGADGLNSPNSVAVSPDGTHVYVAGHADNSVGQYSRDSNPSSPTYGRLTFQADYVTGGSVLLSGASGVMVSPDNTNVYATADTSNAVNVFSRTAGTGNLTWRQALKNSGMDGYGHTMPSTALTNAAAVAVSPDSANVYVIGSNSLTVYKRHTESFGQLEYLNQMFTQTTSPGMNGAIALAVSLDGANVYVAGQTANQVAIFSRSAGTGTLTYQGAVAVGTAPSGIAVGPDNTRVWVTAKNANQLSTFKRNGNMLALLETVTNGVTPPENPGGFAVSGLTGAYGVAVSGDNGNAYVAASVDDAVTWFSVFDPTTVSCSDGSACTGPDFCGGNGICSGPNLAPGTDCTASSSSCTTLALCDNNGVCVDQTCSGVSCGCGGCGCAGTCKIGGNGKCGCNP